MKSKLLASFCVMAAGLFLVSGPVLAHHGFAGRYDEEHPFTVQGTVLEFQFINPHVLIYIEAKNQDGTVEKWTCEATSPNMLYRRGWTKTTLKPGDEITATGHRAKNGTALLRLMKIAANGKEYDNL